MSARGWADPEIAERETRSYRAVLRGEEIGRGTLTVDPFPDRYDVSVELTGALSGVETAIETNVVLARVDGVVRSDRYVTDARVEGEHGRSSAHDEGRLRGVKALNWAERSPSTRPTSSRSSRCRSCSAGCSAVMPASTSRSG